MEFPKTVTDPLKFRDRSRYTDRLKGLHATFGPHSDAVVYWVLDMVRHRANPGDLERILLNTATQDGKRVRIGVRAASGAGRQKPSASSGPRTE